MEMLQLPDPIEMYLRAENSGDVEALSECFAPYATVRDAGRTYEGLPAIKSWKAQTTRKYHHTVTPLDISSSENDAVLEARLDGDFPGSPVTAKFHFVLEHDQIVALQIRS